MRNDIKEIERLFKVLEGLLTDPRDRVYVLASSYNLNQDVLGSAYMSWNRYKEVSRRILPTSNVDKRDGFPQPLLTAQYVIIGSPQQYAVGEKDQRVVGVPAELILTRQGIGTSFERLPYKFVIEDNVKVYIYKKVRPLSDADLNDLSERLRKYYPERKNIYEIKKSELVQ